MLAAPREKKKNAHARRDVARAIPSRRRRGTSGIGIGSRTRVNKATDRETIAALDQAVSFLVRVLLSLSSQLSALSSAFECVFTCPHYYEYLPPVCLLLCVLHGS
jgi:hypothetical protein